MAMKSSPSCSGKSIHRLYECYPDQALTVLRSIQGSLVSYVLSLSLSFLTFIQFLSTVRVT